MIKLVPDCNGSVKSLAVIPSCTSTVNGTVVIELVLLLSGLLVVELLLLVLGLLAVVLTVVGTGGRSSYSDRRCGWHGEEWSKRHSIRGPSSSRPIKL